MENYRKIMDINLDSVFYACQAALGADARAEGRGDPQHRLDLRLHLQHPAAAGRLQRIEGRASTC